MAPEMQRHQKQMSAVPNDDHDVDQYEDGDDGDGHLNESESHQSESSKTQSTGPKGGPQKTTVERARDERKQQEARQVNRARFICLGVFVASTIAVSVIMFNFTEGNEKDFFESEVGACLCRQYSFSMSKVFQHKQSHMCSTSLFKL